MSRFDPIQVISRYARFFRDFRDDRRTERLIAQLPANIRKDIGWPDGYRQRVRLGG
ncbi:MAG: hypothetical protein AB7I79_04820 [Rhizobiaceae bacterium]